MRFAERYIVPGRFPEYSAVAPSADSTRQFELSGPGGPYVFTGLTQNQMTAVPNRIMRIRSANVNDAFTYENKAFVRIESIHEPIFKRVTYHNGEYTLDFDYGADEVRIAGCNFAAHLDLTRASDSILWVNSRAGIEFPEIFENFFRVLVAYRLLQLRGVLFHSAGIVDGANAHIFFGRSGAGKTTVSRIFQAAGSVVLSDDLNALVTTNKGVRTAQLPFCGDLGDTPPASKSYSVSGIYHLQQHKDNAIVEISDAHSVQALLSCCPFVNRDPYRYDILLSNLLSLLQHGNVRALRFNATKDLITLLRS